MKLEVRGNALAEVRNTVAECGIAGEHTTSLRLVLAPWQLGVAVIGGITFLTLAMKTLPVSVAYPIWTAIGTLGTVTLGFALLGEPLTFLKVVSALAIVAGVAGLKIAAG